jgi:hypothetical protein
MNPPSGLAADGEGDFERLAEIETLLPALDEVEAGGGEEVPERRARAGVEFDDERRLGLMAIPAYADLEDDAPS